MCLQSISIGFEINTQEGKLKYGHHREGVEQKKIMLEDHNSSRTEKKCQRQINVQIRESITKNDRLGRFNIQCHYMIVYLNFALKTCEKMYFYI